MKNLMFGILHIVVGIFFQVNNRVHGVQLSEATFGDVSSYIANWCGIFFMFLGIRYLLKALRDWLNAEKDANGYS